MNPRCSCENAGTCAACMTARRIHRTLMDITGLSSEELLALRDKHLHAFPDEPRKGIASLMKELNERARNTGRSEILLYEGPQIPVPTKGGQA